LQQPADGRSAGRRHVDTDALGRLIGRAIGIAGLTRLTRLTGITRLTGLLRITRLLRIAGLGRLARLDGLARRLVGIVGRFIAIRRLARRRIVGRLAWLFRIARRLPGRIPGRGLGLVRCGFAGRVAIPVGLVVPRELRRQRVFGAARFLRLAGRQRFPGCGLPRRIRCGWRLDRRSRRSLR
jgi:hypothetical protein